jgi:hypothetical protein
MQRHDMVQGCRQCMQCGGKCISPVRKSAGLNGRRLAVPCVSTQYVALIQWPVWACRLWPITKEERCLHPVGENTC